MNEQTSDETELRPIIPDCPVNELEGFENFEIFKTEVKDLEVNDDLRAKIQQSGKDMIEQVYD